MTILDWHKYRAHRAADPDAAERGRLMTAHGMANDAEGRKRVEDAIGIPAAMAMYPECYRQTGRSGLAGMIDRFRARVNW